MHEVYRTHIIAQQMNSAILYTDSISMPMTKQVACDAVLPQQAQDFVSTGIALQTVSESGE